MHFVVGWPQEYPIATRVADTKHTKTGKFTGVLTHNQLQIWTFTQEEGLLLGSTERGADAVRDHGENRFVIWKADECHLVIVTRRHRLYFYRLIEDTDTVLYETEPSVTTAHASKFHPVRLKLMKIIWLSELGDGCEITRACATERKIVISTHDSQLIIASWSAATTKKCQISLRKKSTDSPRVVGIGDVCPNDHLKILSVVFTDGSSCLFPYAQLFSTDESRKGLGLKKIGIICQKDACVVRVHHRSYLVAVGTVHGFVDLYSLRNNNGAPEITKLRTLHMKELGFQTKDTGSIRCLTFAPDGQSVLASWSLGGLGAWTLTGTVLLCTLENRNLIGSHNSESKVNLVDYVPTCMEFLPHGHGLLLSLHENGCAQSAILMGLKTLYRPTGNIGLRDQSKRAFLRGQDLCIWAPEVLVDDSESTRFWEYISLSRRYLSNAWPPKEIAVSPNQSLVAVAGKRAFTVLNRKKRIWRSFGNDLQEEEFAVSCMTWLNNHMILAATINFTSAERLGSKYSLIAWPFDHLATASQVIFLRSLQNGAAMGLNVNGDLILLYFPDRSMSIYNYAFNDGESQTSLLYNISPFSIREPHPYRVALWRFSEKRWLIMCLDTGYRLWTINPENGEKVELSEDITEIWLSKEPDHPKKTAVWAYSAEDGYVCFHPEDDSPSMRKAVINEAHPDLVPLGVDDRLVVLMGVRRGMITYSLDTPRFSVRTELFSFLHVTIRNMVDRLQLDEAYHLMNHFQSTGAWRCMSTLELLLQNFLKDANSKDKAHLIQLKFQEMPIINVQREYEVEESDSQEQKPPLVSALSPLNMSRQPSMVDPPGLREQENSVLSDSEPYVLQFLRMFSDYPCIVINVARKMEPHEWGQLFALAETPESLFELCIEREKLEAASKVLFIIEKTNFPRAMHCSKQLQSLASETKMRDLATRVTRYMDRLRLIQEESVGSNIEVPQQDLELQVWTKWWAEKISAGPEKPERRESSEYVSMPSPSHQTSI